MTVQHYTLAPHTRTHVRSTYLSHLDIGTQELLEHPGSYTVSADGPLTFSLYHGRLDPERNMDDWGFEGPQFNCLNVIHDPDRILLQHADFASVALAQRLGLRVHDDTITLDYHEDLVLVPRFRGEDPAYFGDHSAFVN
jgi:hypothetical protein